jgi:DNA-binding MarR family transcriptional regulator
MARRQVHIAPPPTEPLARGRGLTGKVMLLAMLCEDSRLTADQFRVAVTLFLRFHNTGTGECFPSYKQLANASCTSKTTAKRTTKTLKAMGVIDFAHNKGGRSRRNFYTLKTVSPAGPLLSRKAVRGGPFTNGNGVSSGPERVSRADPHIPNEESDEVGDTPSRAPDGRSQASKREIPEKPSPEEIRRRDEALVRLKAVLNRQAGLQAPETRRRG